MDVKVDSTLRLPDLPEVGAATLALPRFREFVRNLRRNEYLKIQQTQAYAEDPETWDEIFADVNDVAYSGLSEGGEKYDCSAAKRYKPYKTKRSTRTGKFITVKRQQK
jgi:hypothetical protein